jgi:uncharacterized protein
MMKKIIPAFLTALLTAFLLVATGLAALDVPPLTGRVVDNAEMIPPAAEREITAYLQSVEESTGAQIAVLTVPALDGEVLEDYSIRVVDQWGLGAADRDNGVLLLVAAAEKKIRLEVGYGLEGVLTDAKSGLIIREIMQPHFQRGNFDRGILEAVQVIGSVAAGDENALPATGRGASASAASGGGFLQAIGEVFFTGFIVFFVFGIGAMGRRRRYGGFGRALFWGMLLSNAGRGRSHGSSRYGRSGFGGIGGSSRGFGGGGFGGFSGGGGGFGGGGASGGW